MSFIFLLFFTFLSSFSSDTSTCIGNGRSGSNAVAERQKSKMPESDQKAFQVHFGNDVEAIQKQRNASNK